MIAYLKGMIADVSEDNLVLEAGQMGFNIKVPLSVISRLPGIGENVKIYTCTCVREDAFLLYGFLTKDDLEIFRKLITVNGVGPRVALGILSFMSADDLRIAIISQDAKTIAKAPGIGAKTAQKLILDLKDKVSLDETSLSGESLTADSALQDGSGIRNEAVEALVALGYSASEALKAIRKIETTEAMSVEDILKAALKNMF